MRRKLQWILLRAFALVVINKLGGHMKRVCAGKKTFNYRVFGCATLMLAAFAISTAVMAESVDVRVIGTIVPGACTPTLGGGGVVDYGTISATTLDPTNYTVLPVKQVPFGVICQAPVKVAIKAINGRKGTLAGAVESGLEGAAVAPAGSVVSPSGSFVVVGLGLDGSTPIGGYTISLSSTGLITESGSVVPVYRNSDNDPTNWRTGTNGLSLYLPFPVTRFLSWSAPGGVLAPLAFTNFSGELSVQAYLNKRSLLDTSHEIKLDGLTTIELVYL